MTQDNARSDLITALQRNVEMLKEKIEELEVKIVKLREQLWGDEEYRTRGKLEDMQHQIDGLKEDLKATNDLLNALIKERDEERAMARGAEKRLNASMVRNFIATAATAIGVLVTIYLAATSGS